KSQGKEKSSNYISSIKIGAERKNEYKINITDTYYSLTAESNPRIPSDNWLIIKSTYTTNNSGFKLREGVMIKLGKVVFKVREVSVDGDLDKVGEGINNLSNLEENMRNQNRIVLDRNLTDNDNYNRNVEVNLELGEDLNDY